MHRSLEVLNANKSCYIQWFQYPESHSTWEVKGNLRRARKIIKEFWNDLGIREGDFDGHEVHASSADIGESFSKLKFEADDSVTKQI